MVLLLSNIKLQVQIIYARYAKKSRSFCSCDASHQYCYEDFFKVHIKTQGEHNEIEVATRLEEISQTKLKSFKFSKNVEKIQKQLQTNFNLLLQGHTSNVTSVAVTSDNKYIVSGSYDNTIRIWKFLKKRQETVLQGHLKGVNSVAVTSDNKYIVSGSGSIFNQDNTIRI